MKIDVCSKKEQDYIIERLVEYNLSQVEAKQKENFIDLSKKIGKDDKIVAGIVARMYCWNVVYVDTLWVDCDRSCGGCISFRCYGRYASCIYTNQTGNDCFHRI